MTDDKTKKKAIEAVAVIYGGCLVIFPFFFHRKKMFFFFFETYEWDTTKHPCCYFDEQGLIQLLQR